MREFTRHRLNEVTMRPIITILFVLLLGGLWANGQNVADLEKRYEKIEFFKVTNNIKLSVFNVRGFACRLAYEQYSTTEGARQQLSINENGMDPFELVGDVEEFMPQAARQGEASPLETRKVGKSGEIRELGWRNFVFEAYYFRRQTLAPSKRDATKLKGLSPLFPYEDGPDLLLVSNTGVCHDK